MKYEISKSLENSEFNLPIYYLDNKLKLDNQVITDLELAECSEQPLTIYNNILSFDKSENNFPLEVNKSLINLWSEYYTNDVEFLNQNQEFLKNFTCSEYYNDYDEILEIYKEINTETNFKNQYQYVDFPFFDPFNLNENPLFLQLLTMYNLFSPVTSLIVPVIVLIFPFFLLKLKGIEINFSSYIDVLCKAFQNNSILNTLRDFQSVGWDRKIMLLTSLIFYFMTIYQNFKLCLKFYKNISKMKSHLNHINKYFEYLNNIIINLNNYCLDKFSGFKNKNEEILEEINKFSFGINNLNLSSFSVFHFSKVGLFMQKFYNLFMNNKINKCISYGLQLDSFIQCIKNLQERIKCKKLNYCKFNKKYSKMTDIYYLPLIDSKPIKNNINFKKNLIITGPNASGKTTILKSSLINIILSLQLGIGAYSKANIVPYKYIYSYLNIPDTSNRDSLFQAEARRCKLIIDNIKNSNKSDKHFCIFDELYSGTNPSEAIASAYSLSNYLCDRNNINFILTTHYISLSNLLDNNSKIINCKMNVENNKETYKITSGISKIKGGIKVLEYLKYPNEIIENTKNIVDKIVI